MKKVETFSISSHEVRILILKRQGHYRKVYYSPFSLMNRDNKNPKKETLATQISSVKKRIYHYQLEFTQVAKLIQH